MPVAEAHLRHWYGGYLALPDGLTKDSVDPEALRHLLSLGSSMLLCWGSIWAVRVLLYSGESDEGPAAWPEHEMAYLQQGIHEAAQGKGRASQVACGYGGLHRASSISCVALGNDGTACTAVG
jgi:hypothetical protein